MLRRSFPAEASWVDGFSLFMARFCLIKKLQSTLWFCVFISFYKISVRKCLFYMIQWTWLTKVMERCKNSGQQKQTVQDLVYILTLSLEWALTTNQPTTNPTNNQFNPINQKNNPKLTNHTTCPQTNQKSTNNQPTNPPIKQPTNKPKNQPTNKQTSKSTNQSNNQPTNPPIQKNNHFNPTYYQTN